MELKEEVIYEEEVSLPFYGKYSKINIKIAEDFIPLTSPGYIYLISDGDFIKIGKSKNPKFRLKELQIANSRKLSLIYTYHTNYANELEWLLHKRFERKNIRGEWYDIANLICMENAMED